MSGSKKTYDFGMFQERIFPLKYEENIGIKYWIWKIASLLHTIFIIFYGVIGVICIKWIFGITQDTDEKFLIIFVYVAFTIIYFMFGFIFMYLRVFLKPLKPFPQKIILTKDSIQINESIIKLNDITNIIAPKDDMSPWYTIYTDADTWYTVRAFLIPGLDLFLKNNFPNTLEYREQEQEKKLQQELGEKYYEYDVLNKKIPFEKISGLLAIIAVVTMFLTSLYAESLILITAILSGCLFFIQKYKIHKLSFLHQYFWICCMVIFVFFIQIYSYAHFSYGWGIDIMIYFFLATLFLLLRALVKSQGPEKYWRALFVISTLVIILGINAGGQWIWEPQTDTLEIEKIEYVYGTRGRSYYNITGSGEKIGNVIDSVSLSTGNKIKSDNKATIQIYKGLLGIDFYTY